MGLFDLLTGGPDRARQKHAARVANKRAQAEDRAASIEFLAVLATPAAVAALLVRFTYSMEPTITDQEEKRRVFEVIVQAESAALEPVRSFAQRAGSLSWPMKIFSALLSPEEYVTELLALLGRCDTDYERDPVRKIQLLTELGEHTDGRIAAAAMRFLEDVNETVRFSVVGTLARQADETACEPLLRALAVEESVRVKMRIAETFDALGWTVQGHRPTVEAALPDVFTVDREGHIHKKAAGR